MSDDLVFLPFYLECLAHASFIVGSKSTGDAFIIDPRRDVDMYLKQLEEHSLRLKGVLLTHLHADFVSGHIPLHNKLGVPTFIGDEAGMDAPHYGVRDGDVFNLSPTLRFRAMTTPGHTPGCVTWLLCGGPGAGEPLKAFTGDTLFIGSVGRPDLVGSIGFTANDMASTMFDSLHSKLLLLPDDVEVWPAHGAGSPCGKALSKELSSTIGEQKATNPALQIHDKEEFVKYMTDGLPPAPQYFSAVVALNKSHAASDPEDVARRVPRLSATDAAALVRGDAADGDGEAKAGDGKEDSAPEVLLLDTREADDFAASHVPGSVNFPIGNSGGVTLRKEDGNFGIWIGTLLAPTAPLLLITAPGKEVETIFRLARVGYQNIVGLVVDGISAWTTAGLPTAATPRMGWSPATADELSAAGSVIVDLRTAGEFGCPARGHVSGAVNVPLGDLVPLVAGADASVEPPASLAGLPKPGTKAIVCYCAGGFRSTIAASILRRRGHTVTDVVGGYDVSILPALKA